MTIAGIAFFSAGCLLLGFVIAGAEEGLGWRCNLCRARYWFRRSCRPCGERLLAQVRAEAEARARMREAAAKAFEQLDQEKFLAQLAQRLRSGGCGEPTCPGCAARRPN